MQIAGRRHDLIMDGISRDIPIRISGVIMDPTPYYFPGFTDFLQACTERKARIATLDRGDGADRALAAGASLLSPWQSL